MDDLGYDPQFRCTAGARSTGDRCKRRAVPGADVCVIHGGAAPQVQAAARRRLLAAETAREVGALLAEVAPDVTDIDPVEGILEALRCAWAMRRMLELVVAELSTAPGSAGAIGPDHKGDGKPHAYLALLGEWTERQGRLSKMAADAGVAERQVRLAEAEADLLARAFRAFATALGLDPAEERVRSAMRASLTLVAGGQAA